MAKKKKPAKKKKQIVYQELLWEWTNVEEPEMIAYLQKFAAHMVYTGISEKWKGNEAARTEELARIMDEEDWHFPQEEMDAYLPLTTIVEELNKVAMIEHEGDTTYKSMSELTYCELCNKLAELCVYGLYRELEKAGHVKLCWDEKKQDFIYVPVDTESDEGEEWKKTT